MSPTAERWPPVYDPDDLKNIIRDLTNDASFFASRFFTLTVAADPPVCQGDVVNLASDVPVLDRQGLPATHESCSFWLVTGNTCDFARELEDVEWTQLVPLIDAGGDELERQAQYPVLLRYTYSRKFYLPPWPGANPPRHHLADLTRPVAIHKDAFPDAAKIVARMDFAAWILFHSCLIRFLCRDDGRFD